MGTVSISLESLVFLCDIKEQLIILDFKGRSVGTVDIHLRPVEPNGKKREEERESPIRFSYGVFHYKAACVKTVSSIVLKNTESYI